MIFIKEENVFYSTNIIYKFFLLGKQIVSYKLFHNFSGQGYYTSEDLIVNEEGKLLTDRTWNYKPPGAKDIPVEFRIKFPENNPNPLGILKSKGNENINKIIYCINTLMCLQKLNWVS